MTEKNFIETYGEEKQEVTRNYATKSLGTNYHIKDAFIEFCDNAYDARNHGVPINIDFSFDKNTKTLTIVDNGTGIIDDTNLFKLGGTDKENDKNKIGKFGIGVPGSISAIARKCVSDKDEMVMVTYESESSNGRIIKHVAILPNGDMIIGKTSYCQRLTDKTYTKIVFTNIELTNMAEICDAIEEVYEVPLNRDANISFNGRQLGKTSKRTFVGDEQVKTVMVGKFATDIKYRIIGGNTDREFEEAALRVYDKKTGRLLAKNNALWYWYAGKQSQQNICGLRCAIYIESNIEAYNKFGIKPAKNGVTYAKYFSSDADFAELANELKAIYAQASKTKPSTLENVYTFGTRTFEVISTKMDKPYIDMGNNSYLIKKKYSSNEIASLINDYITLEKKYERIKSK